MTRVVEKTVGERDRGLCSGEVAMSINLNLFLVATLLLAISVLVCSFII